MSFLKFILSFFFAPIPAPTAPQVNLDKALLKSAEAEVEALKAEVKALKKANARLAIAVDAVEADLVMTNNWLVQALFRANDEGRRADAYKAILASSAARKSSNFRLPTITPDLTEEELNWRRRMTALRFEALFAAYDYEVKDDKKMKSVDKTDKHRGHRCGKTTMNAREIFHYLNR